MNTLTQQQINQYQWQAADGVARMYSKHIKREDWNLIYQQYQTNAPDGIYSGEAFELIGFINDSEWREVPNIRDMSYYENMMDCKYELRLKPSHLTAVLTTQPGEEWKDRYKPLYEYYNAATDKWAECDETHGHPVYPTRTTWHFITPPAEQETETVDAQSILDKQDLHWTYAPNGDHSKPYLHDSDCAFCDVEDRVIIAMEEYAKVVTQQLQSTLTQKDQRIAELEQTIDQCQKGDLYFEQEIEHLNKTVSELENKWISVTIKEPELDSTIMIADLIMGGVAIIDYDEREQLQFFKYWMPLPTPPQH